MTENLDRDVVRHFGHEWSKFDRRPDADAPLEEAEFRKYTAVYPVDRLPPGAVVLDIGCGTGRWAHFVAPHAATLHCIDPSPRVVEVARRNLAAHPNCEFHVAGMAGIPLADESADFAYALGVLHVVPDPEAALAASVAKLKPGGAYLVYALYALDNRPAWFRAAWRVADVVRRLVSRLPHPARRVIADVIAVTVYWPLSRLAGALERRGVRPERLPLAEYRGESLYRLRTDALDRFGTRREHRFSAEELRRIMQAAGLADVAISPDPPYWCAVGFKPGPSAGAAQDDAGHDERP